MRPSEWLLSIRIGLWNLSRLSLAEVVGSFLFLKRTPLNGSPTVWFSIFCFNEMKSETHDSVYIQILGLFIYFYWMNWGEKLLALMLSLTSYEPTSCSQNDPMMLHSHHQCSCTNDNIFADTVFLCLDRWRSLHTHFCHLWLQGFCFFPSVLLCFRSFCYLELAGTFRYSFEECSEHLPCLVPNLGENVFHS